MTSLAYTRFELLRALRNKRFFFFSLGFPLILYFLIAGPQTGEHNLNNTGLSAPLYFMVSMASWGTITAMLSTGARIAGERAVGWNRQLRISPLKPGAYLATKVGISYMMAIASMVSLFIAGTILGVTLGAGKWLEMLGLILVGLIPFAAGGVWAGHKLTIDTIGPAIGGGTALLAFVSGIWFPLAHHGFLYDVGRELPSYYLVQAGHVALGGSAWPARGWIVIAVWSVVLTVMATKAYLADTSRA